MLLAPKRGFVFLATTKTASTSIERAFHPYSQMVLRGNPFKHSKYSDFQRFLQPFLESKNFPRDSYEVVCVIREPIDWLASWWRYRSREDLADPSHSNHRNYAGHLSFEQFAHTYMNGTKRHARVGRPSEFLRSRPGQAEVDRLFRYDHLDMLVDFLCDKVGEEVEVGVRNVSPKRSFSLSEGCERELRAFFESEYRIYEGAIAR
jgi:hypothetical protein